MAKSRKRRSSKSRKSVAAPKGGKHIGLGGRKYHCYAKKVKKGFGRAGKTVRAFCRRDVKK